MNYCRLVPESSINHSETQLFRGQWGLSTDGNFLPDPWVVIIDGKTMEFGFGDPPSGIAEVNLPQGVILPGLVNAHTHLELSVYKKPPEANPINGVFNFAQKMMMDNQKSARHLSYEHDLENKTGKKKLEAAIKEINKGTDEGTFYFVDICNDPQFSQDISGEFLGMRFLEILGFSSKHDVQRIKTAAEAVKVDAGIIPAPHSVYGSSPNIFRFIYETNSNWASIHFLEDADEKKLLQGLGAAKEFLTQIGQYQEYPEMPGGDIVEYLNSTGFLKKKNILFVHALGVNEQDIQKIENSCENPIWVICARSNAYLSYTRKNWEHLIKANGPILLGTDSCATTDDLSIIREIQYLISLDVQPAHKWFVAATFDAYKALGISIKDVPFYYFQGCTPDADSLSKQKGVCLLDVKF